ncbi:hypothetical protein LSTR_LSTR009450 [Laodelphax striatellus]|uniref:p53 DNA-binding domain-containing protein n=1 Tax=Laodelphax striatellus TaxID=195883 RepID=A0A482X423_LAOST|nr:hypothetical protein LSTR_LSTR009450 [Laodelphax striatellus]
MDMNSQESEIINEGVLKYIMDDLGTSQPYMFLQDNDAYVDIYNPAHQQHLNNENLLQQHQIKSEHQLQQHLNEDCQLQQHLTDGSHLQQQQQHLNNDRHLHEQHLNNNPHLQQQQFDNHQLQQQQHVNEDHQLPQQQPLTDGIQLHHHQQQQQQNTNNDNRQLMDGGGEAMGGGEVGAPPPPQHTSPTGLQPCLTIYPGCYDFHVTVANTHNGRHAWVYSSKLQKIYIDIDKVLMLQFRLNTVDVKGLCVRALLVYSGPDHDANHSPGIATLLEEVQKLHAKFDQLNNLHAKFDQLNNKVDKILRELAPNLRDDNSRPNKIEITGHHKTREQVAESPQPHP